MTILMLAAALAAATTAQPAKPRTTTANRTARPAASAKPEDLRVSAIDLDDEEGTTFTLKDAAGVKLEPVKVPLSICRKDHLGRLLPGLDVQLVVERKTGADGKPVRFVRPERFRAWCN
jgi:hypothetical protein